MNTKFLTGDMLLEMVRSGAECLQLHCDEVNDLNVFPIPDGDTGDNMYRTIKGGIDQMNSVSGGVQDKAKALAQGMLVNARGNSGVILSQLFAGLSTGLNGLEKANISEIVNAMNEAVKKAYAAVLPPTEGTILTVARESYEEANKNIDSLKTLGELSTFVLNEMYKSLEHTPELLAVLKEAGVIDSGGAGLYCICTGIKDCIFDNLNDYEKDIEHSNDVSNKNVDFSLFTEDSTLEFGYCTEVLLRLLNSKVNVKEFNEQVIIDYLNTIGDSLVCFKNDSIVKVHVHTMTPDKVLAFCQQFGEFLTIKIENMTLQHNEVVTKESSQNKETNEAKFSGLPKAKKQTEKYASIVVCDGEGITAMFKDLGVSYCINGGQGHNPSVNDFIDAFDAVNAYNIFVFPNNSNIKLAAEQAKQNYDKANVYVIPTANIGEAYSALSLLDYTYENPDDLYNFFMENYKAATTVMLCKATRDVTLNNVEIVKDNYLAFENKQIICSYKTLEETFMKMLDKYEDASILTIFFGSGATEEQKDNIRSLITKEKPNIEFYDLNGDQETFDCIVIIE